MPDITPTFLVAGAWIGTGIGHSMYYTALWLTLAAHLRVRVRFAACLPLSTNRPAALPRDMILPDCAAATTFDLYEHITRAGERIRATSRNFEAADASNLALGSPSCKHIVDAAARRENATVLVYRSSGGSLEGCLRSLTPRATLHNHLNQSFFDQRVTVTELRKLTLSPPRTPLPCHVGLHLRTMAIDEDGCNAFLFPGSCDKTNRRYHGACSLSQLAAAPGYCSTAPRFVTSDDPTMYARLGANWSNSGDRAVATWSRANSTVAPAGFKARAKDTVAAWLTLASCKVLVAPVGSAFSNLARLRAGGGARHPDPHFVPIKQCCDPANS